MDHLNKRLHHHPPIPPLSPSSPNFIFKTEKKEKEKYLYVREK